MCMACGAGIPKKRVWSEDTMLDNTLVHSTELQHTLEVAFGSSLRAMNTAINLCRDFLKRKDISEDTKIHIVLRELFMNAVHHGNQMAVERKVTVRLEWSPPDGVTIRVEDEGPGFDYRALSMTPPANPARMNHRGFILIHALCDGIEFNEKGNCVVAHICSSKNVVAG